MNAVIEESIKSRVLKLHAGTTHEENPCKVPRTFFRQKMGDDETFYERTVLQVYSNLECGTKSTEASNYLIRKNMRFT